MIALVWFRRDLRLADNPALHAALSRGYAVLPVYIHDPAGEGDWAAGAASNAWLRRSLQALQADIQARGGRLILRAGDSGRLLTELARECGASALFWNRRYEPAVRTRDERIKSSLRQAGLDCESFNAALINEPWTIQTGQGEPYRVFTPYWRKASASLDLLPPPLPAPERFPPLPAPAGVTLDDMLPAPRPAWDRGFWECAQPGAAGAQARLQAFLPRLGGYAEQRDLPAREATSGLSAALAFGEISPRQIVHAIEQCGRRAEASSFLRELGWREFSYHLLFHFPHCTDADLTTQMQGFDWAPPRPDLLAAWQQGRTGIPMVDAAMRELWHTGIMHNRCRMLVASLLCKNLRYHWQHGARWFWDTLVDADLANNSQGWQWSAGTGADAAPYFRVFNPVGQGERFDPQGAYLRRWLPELARVPERYLHAPWTCPDLGRLAPDYPRQPVVDLATSREAALAAWKHCRSLRGV